MNDLNEGLQTFQFGGGYGDIYGDDLDIGSIPANLTDTLLGNIDGVEFNSALGDPALDEFEQYYQGEGGVADIKLAAFDSALIQEAGIGKNFIQDIDMDEEEFRRSIGIKPGTPSTKDKDKTKKEEKPKEKEEKLEKQVTVVEKAKETKVDELPSDIESLFKNMGTQMYMGTFFNKAANREYMHFEDGTYSIVDEVYITEDGNIIDTEDEVFEEDFAETTAAEWAALCSGECSED